MKFRSVYFFIMIITLCSLCKLQAHQDFFVVTPEKTGTHLLTKLLSQLFDQNCIHNWNHEISRVDLMNLLMAAKEQNTFVQMHALPTKEIIKTLKELNYKVIFLLRDPRDQAVSLLFYIQKGWAYGPLRMNMPFGQLSFNDKLDEIITGRRYGLSATKGIIGRRIPWMYQDQSFVLTVFFENLVGKEGGGSRKRQLQEAMNIVSFLDADLTDQQVDDRSLGIFGSPGEGTFRNGVIGAWKNHFTQSHKSGMKNVFGEELITLGYENNFNW